LLCSGNGEQRKFSYAFTYRHARMHKRSHTHIYNRLQMLKYEQTSHKCTKCIIINHYIPPPRIILVFFQINYIVTLQVTRFGVFIGKWILRTLKSRNYKDYGTLANLRTLNYTTAHTNSSQFIFSSGCLITDPNNVLFCSRR
jgi:hypothetical protein